MVLGQWSTGLAVGYLASSLVAGINDINSGISEGGGLSFEHTDRVTGRWSHELRAEGKNSAKSLFSKSQFSA